MNNGAADKYVELVSRFVTGKISAQDFERAYLDLFKSEKQPFAADDFEILDSLFADVDAFCSDSTLRGPDDLDEQQLKDKCSKALVALNQNRKVPA